MNLEDVLQLLQAKGYPSHITAGIAGNIGQESGFNPNAINPNAGDFGFAQWTGPRKEELFRFASNRGVHPTDPALQVDFMDHELNTTEKRARDALMKAQTPAEAALVFSNKFERPNAKYANNDRRVSIAEKAMNFIMPTASADETPYTNEELAKIAGVTLIKDEQPAPVEQPQQQYTNEELAAIAGVKLLPDDKTTQTNWSDVPGQALSNLPKSAGQFVSGIANTLTHPGEVLGAAQGAVQNILPDSVNKALAEYMPGYDLKNEATADAIGQFYKDRYGSMEGFKQALANDPVGVAADVSTLFGGAGGLLKSPTLRTASRITNPMTAVGKGIEAIGYAAPKVGKLSSIVIGNLGTHTGAESLNRAAGAGFAGGQKLAAVTDNMRGLVDQADVVPKLKAALADMRAQNYAAYQEKMQGIKGAPETLNIEKVEDAVNKALNEGTYAGRTGSSGITINVNKAADSVKKQVTRLVSDFKKAPKEEFHTPGGFDELKRGIGNIMDGYDYGSPQYRVAKQVYDVVKGQIVEQSPIYAKIMADSQKGIELTKEIERSLKLGDKTSADTSLRALQSVMRNNANSNFGSRVKNVERLGGNVMEDLAGQTLNAWTPRGIGGTMAGGIGLLGAYLHSPLLASSLLFQSPRLMGETAVKLGQGARIAGDLTNNNLMQMLARGITPLGLSGLQNR